MKRINAIKSVSFLIDVIMSGHYVCHEKCFLSPSQMKTWPLSRIVEKVKEGKLYTVREDVKNETF